jgi:hypothetical protein
MKRICGKLTYANVMATVAVFIALGGAGYAAVKLPKNSVGAKQIKANAVTGAKIKNGAVTAAKIAPGAVGTVATATNATHAQSADNAATATRAVTATRATSAETAADAEALGGVGAAGYQPRTMWAYVDNSGQILSQSGGISVEAHIQGGTWLNFPQQVGGKAIVASPWAGDTGYETSVEVAPCGYVGETATPGSIACDHGTNTLNDAFVATENEGTGAFLAFYVVVIP